MRDLDLIKKLDTKRLLMAVAMTAFMMNAAYAAEPRSEAAVERDVVTVGDVFSGVTHDATYVLAPAPAYGKTLTLNHDDLKRISDAFSLGWVPASQMTQVIVRRSAQEIAPDKIETALIDKLAESLKGRKFGMQLADRGLAFHIPENLNPSIAVSDLKYDLNRGDFRAIVSIPANSDKPVVRQEVSGRLFPVTSVPVLKSGLQQGDVITADDLDYIDLRNTDIGANVVVDAQKIIGMSPRRGLQPLKPMVAGDILPPVMVKKGEMVTITLESATMSLTTQGKAMENGAAGEVIKIINTSSGQSLDAVVTGARTVTVSAPQAEM